MKVIKSFQKAGWLLIALTLVLGLVVQGVAGQTAGVTIQQWASTAIASSEYSSTRWSAAQATGAPNTFTYGDIDTAWTTRGADEGIQWIELKYNTPVFAKGVNLHETYNPGALTRIDMKETNGVYNTVWEGTDPGVGKTSIAWSNLSFEETTYHTNTIKVYIDTSVPGWNEIDAIELIGEPTSISGTTVTPSPSLYSLSATPTTVAPGQKITVTYTAPGYRQDWIAIYAITAKNDDWSEYYYLGAKTSGTLTFTAPSQAGEYELRMFQNWPDGGYEDIARSSRIRVSTTPTTTTPTTTIPPTTIPTTVPVSKKCTGTESYLYIVDRTMNKGNTVEIPIMMCNADNLANMDVTLNYDTSILKIKDITKGSLNQRAIFDWNEVSAGRLKISFAGKEEVSGSGSIAVMIFDVLGNTGATTLIGGTVTTASRTGGITISVRVDPGTVTVGNPSVNGDCNGDTKLDERDVLAALQMAVEKRASNMCYDYNKDGKVDSLDARDMLKAIVRGGG